MKNKKDYIKGINILKKYLINKGLYTIYYGIVGHSTWVFTVSEILAEKGVCELFWKNTVKQNLASNILLSREIEDIFYDKYFFLWDETDEGDEFWCRKSEEICDKYIERMGNRYLYPDENNEDIEDLFFDD